MFSCLSHPLPPKSTHIPSGEALVLPQNKHGPLKTGGHPREGRPGARCFPLGLRVSAAQPDAGRPRAVTTATERLPGGVAAPLHDARTHVRASCHLSNRRASDQSLSPEALSPDALAKGRQRRPPLPRQQSGARELLTAPCAHCLLLPLPDGVQAGRVWVLRVRGAGRCCDVCSSPSLAAYPGRWSPLCLLKFIFICSLQTSVF